MEKEALKVQIKEQIIEYLNLIDITPVMIKDDAPLFGGELELDSIDSLELVVMLEREYGIKIKDPREGRKVFGCINDMVDFIHNHQNA